MKCLLCAIDIPHVSLQFLQEPDKVGNTIPFTGEDTEGLQPKPKAIKADGWNLGC